MEGHIGLLYFLWLDCWISAIPLQTFPKNEMEYFKSRDDLLEAEKLFEKRNWTLSEDEKIVDNFLAYHKWKDMQFFGKDNFPPSKPIEKMLQPVQQTQLYSYLRKLPKGGNLHSHEDHQLSKRLLFDIVWSSRDFDYLYIVTDESSPDAWMMDFFVNPPTDKKWVKVKESGLSKEKLLEKNTLLGLMTANASNNPTDASQRWNLINPLWGRASVQLISNVAIKHKYLTAMYEQSLSEGITYLETRRSLGWELPIYELDKSGASSKTNGKSFLDTTYEYEVQVAKETTKQFIEKNPRFIDHKRISYAVRFMDFKMFDKIKNTTLMLHEKYPEHVIGFDAVGEEDAGYSSLHYLDNYLSLHQNGKSRLPLYLHSVETSWPDDLLTSSFPGDLVPTLQNGYDNLILMAKRVGHGNGFIKKPFLREILKSRNTAVEICVVSNQILAMEADIRNNHGQILYKEKIPIVLAPDDPGTFGYDNATVDWYMAYLGWGLNLGDLKQIALNSLLYSGMNETEKSDAIDNKWRPSWDEYIATMKATACKYNFNSSQVPTIHRVFPNNIQSGIKVHIFGRNFESAICKNLKCIFGSSKVDASYESNQHITCIAPNCNDCAELLISSDKDKVKSNSFSINYIPQSDSP